LSFPLAFISLLYAYTFCVIVFLFIHIVMHKIFLCITVDFVIGHSVFESALLLLLLLLLPLSFVLILILIVITTMAGLTGICM
jgi:hypothetical protein